VIDDQAPYRLALTPTARRQLTENLPEAVAVEHRQVQPHGPAGQPLLDAGVLGEGAARPTPGDRRRLPDEARSGQWLQGPLVVVLQPDADVGATDGGDLLGHQPAHQPGRHEVCPVEQGAQHALAEALGARPALLVDQANARPGRRCLYRDSVMVVPVVRHPLSNQVPPHEG
jgi:hypothetical protein